MGRGYFQVPVDGLELMLERNDIGLNKTYIVYKVNGKFYYNI